MKNTTLTVTFEEEKLSALKIYLEQKGQTVEGELEKSLEIMFQKNVPVGVREFLEMRSGVIKPTEKKKRNIQKQDGEE